MAAFGAFEKSGFGLIRASGLLGPIIGNIIAAFFAGNFNFWMRFHLFHNLDLFPGFGFFFYFRTDFPFRGFGETTAAEKYLLPGPLFRPQDRTTFRAKHFYPPPLSIVYNSLIF
jgi:hypothetical protein